MTSLANKYRPKTFDEVLGQQAVLQILRRQVESDTVRNCYLFCGATGSGKSTCARILARGVNGGLGLPIEIDAASNNSVDNIRNIVKDASERAIDGKYKVIIMDEVQALSSMAWQGLLKYIEEPAPYTILIMCTTEPQKVPATIMNRVQRFDFTRISTEDIHGRLEFVCKEEGIVAEANALLYLSKLANGCMREALTLLDKCKDYNNEISLENVIQALGSYSYVTFFDLINSMIDGNEKQVLFTVNNLYDEGKDLAQFVTQFLKFTIDVIKYILFQTCDVTSIPSSMESDIKSIINFESPSQYYNYVTDKLLELKNMLRQDADVKSTVEVVFLQITRMQ